MTRKQLERTIWKQLKIVLRDKTYCDVDEILWAVDAWAFAIVGEDAAAAAGYNDARKEIRQQIQEAS